MQKTIDLFRSYCISLFGQVHALKDLYDNGVGSVNAIRRHEPNVIASFLKVVFVK